MRLAARVWRLALGSVAIAVLVAGHASAQGSRSAEQQLAANYAPLLSLDPQRTSCGSGEAYRPTVVDIALGRQSVMLRDAHGAVVKRGPTSADLWRHAGAGYYLGFPGDPLNPAPRPLRRRRQGGQIFRATTRVYVRNLPIFVAAGAIFVPVYLAAAGIPWIVFHLSSAAPLVALDGRHGAVTAFLALLIGSIGGLFASVITTGAVAVILDEIDAGRRILAGQAYARVLRRIRPLLRGMFTELVMVILLTITIVGIPFAIHRFVRWSLFAEACVLDDLPATESLRRSSELVWGQWWRTCGFTALIDVLAILSGPLFGVGLLLLTDHSLNFINLAAALVYTVTMPYAAIQLTLYYFDLEAREAAEPMAAG